MTPRMIRFHIFTYVARLLPPTRCFRARNALLRLAGLDIRAGAQIQGSVRFFSPDVTIGENTWVGPGCMIISSGGARVAIGRDIGIAPGCIMATGSHEIGDSSHRAGPGYNRSIHIGDGSWIGLGARILCGVTIGKGCVVAAGAVCNKSTEDDVLVGGVPAKVIRRLDPKLGDA